MARDWGSGIGFWVVKASESGLQALILVCGMAFGGYVVYVSGHGACGAGPVV